ncbi:hypothetical protein QYF36_013404 [Acer negundo]|nr:hypothetical protein QYF36_013404 [Acer negundo]
MVSENWARRRRRFKSSNHSRRSSKEMQRLGDFKLPAFFNYPPYFTLQPVRETREKQVQLWKELILDYCRTQKIFVIGLEEEFPLFSNLVIEKLQGMDRTVLMRALKVLEHKGKLAIFKGTSADDEGVKFSI